MVYKSLEKRKRLLLLHPHSGNALRQNDTATTLDKKRIFAFIWWDEDLEKGLKKSKKRFGLCWEKKLSLPSLTDRKGKQVHFKIYWKRREKIISKKVFETLAGLKRSCTFAPANTGSREANGVGDKKRMIRS